MLVLAVLTFMSGCAGPGKGHSIPAVPSVDQALSRADPYTISVLGDSTGNDKNEWVHILARRISKNYERTVVVHDWDIDTNTFTKVTTYGSGPSTTIWNASGSGKSAQYSLQYFQRMTPDTPDLTFINHGHNDPWNALDGITKLVKMTQDAGNGPIAVIIQNPRLDGGRPGRAKLEANVFRDIADYFANPETGVTVVDVFSQFPAGDQLAGALRPDGLHPSDEWQQVWADSVAEKLKLR